MFVLGAHSTRWGVWLKTGATSMHPQAETGAPAEFFALPALAAVFLKISNHNEQSAIRTKITATRTTATDFWENQCLFCFGSRSK
jgi:hypothetical protein